jgi:high-affinity Fe2+/Pb2+ permease
MTENQALWITAIVGIPIALACVWLLGTLGVGENILLVAAMMAIVVPSFMVGVIGEHYRRKRAADGRSSEHR